MEQIKIPSTFEIFKVGVGPSSSHTIGPMIAAFDFISSLNFVPDSIRAELYGSLALTGKGHGTDRAILAGLTGYSPETVPNGTLQTIVEKAALEKSLTIGTGHSVPFSYETFFTFRSSERKPFHPNALELMAENAAGEKKVALYYSVGGGFVLDENQNPLNGAWTFEKPPVHPFNNGVGLLNLCKENKLSISSLMLRNEIAAFGKESVDDQLGILTNEMLNCIELGLSETGILPGGLMVKRRAKGLYEQLAADTTPNHFKGIELLSAYALAVCEQNAAFGKVVTAPTNGAAGIIPAVMKYYLDDIGGTERGTHKFLLTAAAIAIIFKFGASLSAAEMGCQGETGVAAAMAAAGLTEAMGGTPEQCEMAAEIAIEHSLGLTCDPIAGLVQIPCIERNAMAAVKAVNASRLALRSDGTHRVSLDEAVAAMRQIGNDMSTRYKETAQGGLAISVKIPEC